MKAEEKLIEDGFSSVSFPHQELVHLVSEHFLAFLKEGQEYKDQWTFDLENGDPDDGYFCRGGEEVDGRKYDVKDVFHYRESLPELLRKRGVNYARHQKLLDACSQLFDLCRDKSFDLAQGIDHELGGFGFKDEMKKAEENPPPYSRSVLRLVSYHSDGKEALVAGEHTDRSFLTLHLDGSDLSSLQVEGVSSSYKVGPGCIRAFLGQKAENHSKGYLRAPWHGVTPSSKGHHWSIVYFAHIGPALQHGKHR